MSNLNEFGLSEKIYIDSNIFMQVIRKAKHWQECKTFLGKIELDIISGVISPLVIDEVVFNVIIDELAVHLKEKSYKKILIQLKTNPDLIKIVTPKILIFKEFIEKAKGLKLISLPEKLGLSLFSAIVDFKLLPRDALHYLIAKNSHINHIASLYSDMYRISDMTIWTL